MRHALVLATVLVLLASPALAAEVMSFEPAAGVPGDLVSVRGQGFSVDSAVTFGSTAAEVLKACDHALLCRVPEGLSAGTAVIAVDGTEAVDPFTVLAAGTPVVYRTSATRGTSGQAVWVYGLRLLGSSVAFVDGDGTETATASVSGGWHAGVFRVPETLAAGTVTLVFRNVRGLDTGDASPSFDVVEAGTPALASARPDAAPPGAPIVLQGSDLGPVGPCGVTWTGQGGATVTVPGLSNGYDRVASRVPPMLPPETAFDVHVTPRGGEATGALAYTLGTRPDPVIEALLPDAGEAGTVFAVLGRWLLAYGETTTVAMTMGSTTVQAPILVPQARMLAGLSGILCAVPDDLVDGDWAVTVTVGDRTSSPRTFTVGPLPLAVTEMAPRLQGPKGPLRPVALVGTGFGTDDDTPLVVLWDDGSEAREGVLLYRSERLLVVAPPGGSHDPLPAGTYVVTVVLDPDANPASAEAGTYVVR